MSSPPVTHSHRRGRSEVWAQVTRLPRPGGARQQGQAQLGFGQQFGHGDRHAWLLFMSLEASAQPLIHMYKPLGYL